MNTLRFEVPLDDPPGFRADAVLGESIFEVLSEPRDLRRLRASLMDIARLAAAKPVRRGLLVLDSPQITDQRLFDEWAGVGTVVKPEVFRRLVMILHREGAPHQTTGPLSPEEKASIPAVIQTARGHSAKGQRRPSEAFFDILRILLIHWFRQSGPLTSKELSEEGGFSYPTVSNTLEKLEPYLTRHSDRSVELRIFPHGAWSVLAPQSEKVRSSRRYADRSGRPRSPEVLMERLRELERPDIAVGGVAGARHYVPGLDLIGSPRLDFVVAARHPQSECDFLRRLDPALKPAERNEPAQVVIHTLYRPKTFFQKGDDGTVWADQVECLLDLYEARLEVLAMEFKEHLIRRVNS